MNKTLTSERLDYRFFKNDDLPFLEELLSNMEVCRYLPIKDIYPLPVIRRILDFYIEAHQRDRHQFIYLVTPKGETHPIGYVGIQMVREFKKYEIFYAYLPSSWGHGYATEAAQTMKTLAKEIGLEEVIALADIENQGSQNVLKKIGYVKKRKLLLWGLQMYYYEMRLVPKKPLEE